MVRFDRTERWVHWTTAALFGVCVATALPLYIGALAVLVGRRELLAQVHVAAGLSLPFPFLFACAGRRWGRVLRGDVARLNRWIADDRRWLRSWGRDPLVRSGKFNGGQKLNSAFTAGAILVMVASGVVMRWFSPFPVTWRTGATFVHDVLAVVLVITLAGHVIYALSDREALRSMVRGWIGAAWADHHAPRWREERAAGRGSDHAAQVEPPG